MRVSVCYKASKCVGQISKRTQADRVSVGEINSVLMGGIDEVNGVVSNGLEVWKDRAL
jgi:hypothetical protein